MPTNWLKQLPEQPLFPEIVWSRPENKRSAGKLLIIGGNLHEFKTPADFYVLAEKAGIGAARIILPDSLAKTIGKLFPEAIFAPSTPSGSFANAALAEFLENAGWADAVLLAGEFGKNSETTILLENFIQKYGGYLSLAGDSLNPFFSNQTILARPYTLICAELATLQKLAAGQILIKQSTDLQQLVEVLSALTEQVPIHILTVKNGQAVVASSGRVSTTPSKKNFNELSAAATVFWLQNLGKSFEAITTAAL